MSQTRSPAPNPCGSCPYRQDVPSGVWAAEEYDKLPAYDNDTWEQPQGVFLCHQQDGRICAGWAGCHDMGNSLAVRMAAIGYHLSPETVDDLLDYQTSVPLWSSGTEAAAHGRADIETPGSKAKKIVAKLDKKISQKEVSP